MVGREPMGIRIERVWHTMAIGTLGIRNRIGFRRGGSSPWLKTSRQQQRRLYKKNKFYGSKKEKNKKKGD